MMTVGFDSSECTCEHGQMVHDDGFGCTEPGCPCVARWSWEDTPEEEL